MNGSDVSKSSASGQRVSGTRKSHTDHYQETLSHVPAVESYEDFRAVPLLEKADIRKDYKRLVTRGTDVERCSIWQTSGSTGIPIISVRTKQEVFNAVLKMSRERRKWSEEAYFGTTACFERIKEPLKYELNDGKKNKLIFSLYENNAERFDLYAAALKEFKPIILQGYSSLLYQFSKHIMENRIELPPIALIENRSEHLSEGQREQIEAAFRSKMSNFYGLAEVFPIAYECPHKKMHVLTDNVLVEIVADDNPDQVLGEGETGEIILTSLNCKTMPFIRYRSGDLGALETVECACGSSEPVLHLLQGRKSDVIVTPDGDLNPVVLRRLFNHFYKDEFLGIAQLQFIQQEMYKFRINIVASRELNEQTLENVSKLVRDCFSYPIQVDIHIVDRLKEHPVRKSKRIYFRDGAGERIMIFELLMEAEARWGNRSLVELESGETWTYSSFLQRVERESPNFSRKDWGRGGSSSSLKMTGRSCWNFCLRLPL